MWRQLCVGRDDAHLLLAVEHESPVLVPAHVELPVVLLDPLPRRVVRRLARRARVVKQERLVGRVDVGVEDEPDRMIDGVLVEVIPLVRPLFGLDRMVVVRQLGIPAARLATKPAIEPLKPPPDRPAVKRARWRAVLRRRDVPLARDERVVALRLENLRDHPVLRRHPPIRARKAGRDLRDARDVVGMVVAAGQDARPRWRADRRRMHIRVPQAVRGETVKRRRLNKPAERARLPVADIVEHEEDHVRSALGSAGHGRPGGARLLDRATNHTAERCPRLILDNRHRRTPSLAQ